MLVLQDYFTSENLNFQNSSELKEFLQMQNPTVLKKYKEQIKKARSDLIVEGIGTGIRIHKK